MPIGALAYVSLNPTLVSAFTNKEDNSSRERKAKKTVNEEPIIPGNFSNSKTETCRKEWTYTPPAKGLTWKSSLLPSTGNFRISAEVVETNLNGFVTANTFATDRFTSKHEQQNRFGLVEAYLLSLKSKRRVKDITYSDGLNETSKVIKIGRAHV